MLHNGRGLSTFLQNRQHAVYAFDGWQVDISTNSAVTHQYRLQLKYHLRENRLSFIPAGHDQSPAILLEIRFPERAVVTRADIFPASYRPDDVPQCPYANVICLEIFPNWRVAFVSAEPDAAVSDSSPNAASGGMFVPRPTQGRVIHASDEMFVPHPTQSVFRPRSVSPVQPAESNPAEQPPHFRPRSSAETVLIQQNPPPESQPVQANPAQEAELSALRETVQNLRAELEQTRQELSAARNETERELSAARNETAQERQRNEQLQNMLSVQTDRLITELLSGQEHLREELRTKTQELQIKTQETQTLQAQIQSASENIQTLENNLHHLRTQTDTMKRQEEILTLDCQQAQGELDGLRTRFHDDDDALRFLREESDFLSDQPTLDSMMQNIRENLDTAEQQIGDIVRWRESINSRVQKAILSGSGLLDTDAEWKK